MADNITADLQNNEQFGISWLSAISKKYSLPNQYVDRQNDKLVRTILKSGVLEELFTKIGSLPKKNIQSNPDYIIEGSTRSPHNFLLRNGQTLNIKTNLSYDIKSCPNVVGQPGEETFEHHFGHLFSSSITRDSFKKTVIEKINEFIPIYVDYLFISDVTVFISFKKGSLSRSINDVTYRMIRRGEIPEFEWSKKDFSFTKTASSWIESNTVKYQNKALGEFQVHKNRYVKFRFNTNNLLDILLEKIENNETFGMSAEIAICKVYDLDYDKRLDKRGSENWISKFMPVIPILLSNAPLPKKYVGGEKGARGGASKSNVDFLLESDKTMSVKTNRTKTMKVCPSEIGQPGYKTFDAYFGNKGWYEPPIDEHKFKQMVLQNPDSLLNEYLTKVFDNDFLLWMYLSREKDILGKLLVSNDYTNVHFNKDLISFSRTLSQWNESNTIKYAGKSIGEFQVHSGRRSLKFRFILDNVIELNEE
jgi:hypothetical protein